MVSGENFNSEKLTLRNNLRNSSILSARVFKKVQVVFSAISWIKWKERQERRLILEAP